jgi:glycosyltransferase involved in cell wall biosynthesis
MINQNNKTKVAFVSIFAYPLFNPECKLSFGGAEVQISLISRELARDVDFDVNVVVADTGQGFVEVIDNVSIYKSYKRGRSIMNLLNAPFQLYKTLKKINPDVIITRAAGVEVGIALFYAKINKKKFIYSIASNKDLDGSRFAGLRGAIFKYGLMNADSLVTQSKDQIDMIEKDINLKNKETILIKNSFKKERNSTPENLLSSVDDLSCTPGHPLSSANDSPRHSELDSESRKINKKHILWVGRSVEMKRPELFTRLAKELPDNDFVMILPKEENDIYKKINKEATLIENLQLVEKVPFNEIQSYYNSASLFVNTSTHEGFPNTFIQSCMASTPVLSIKVNPDNFLSEYECGLVCGDDFEKMKESVKKILDNEEYYEKLSNNAKEYFVKNHDIEKNIIEWKKYLLKP